jgi:hypothetical protein
MSNVRPVPAPRWRRNFACRCGRPVFFPNTRCLACGAALGFDPERLAMISVEPSDDDDLWREALPEGAAPAPDGTPVARWRRCVNLTTASGCNWLVAEHDAQAGSPAQCRCCRLLRTVPDLSSAQNTLWFQRVETARRHLVATLIGLGLPVRSRLSEDVERGLVFDVLLADPGQPAVVTGHAEGVITIDLHEADDAQREQRRLSLGEPYRTLLGHLRHESGHYFWQRLVQDDPAQLATWRECFGDERQDYVQALQRHYAEGAPADWSLHFVSAYASSHPWEDWAETWAHYLHMSDTLDTARSYGLDGSMVALDYEPLAGDDAALGDPGFAALVRSWMELSGVLNELSRSMGVADFYPFVLSPQAVRKLHAVHRLITELV